ncbi:MAG: tRNA (adenosine(37)-N6)-dimethylallyltransferase MiaA [Candidatus Omnitrophota bacterium]
MKPTIICIVGPTSSGKSAVAARLARKINGEVVSCDSMQVYKDMDVITRPPGEYLLSLAVHHLIKTLPPEEEFSAARFAAEAKGIIESISSKGKVPIVAGGTGLYMKALVDGIFPSPPKDKDLRRKLCAIVSEKGKEYLHARLKEVDPQTASRLHPNDTRRVIRALEVYELTGRTINAKKTESEGVSMNYDCRMFGLSLPRKMLYERIDSAVDEMFEEGLVEEVKRLNTRRLSLTAEKALGIKEVSAFLNGQVDLEKAKKELKKNTRRYAKRQLTWVRPDRRVIWVNANRGVEEIVEDIVNRLQAAGYKLQACSL